MKKYFDLSDRRHRGMSDPKPAQTLAVIGAGDGCGCTHYSIACANYIKGVSGEPTALIMAGGDNTMNSIRDMCEVKDIVFSEGMEQLADHENCFEFYGVDYYSALDGRNIKELFNSNYRHIVIDCGDMAKGVTGDVLFASGKIVIGSLMPWKCKEYDIFCENNISYINKPGWYFFMRNGEKGDTAYFKDKYGIKIKKIPEFSNPYRIGRDEKEFFENEGRCIFCL